MPPHPTLSPSRGRGLDPISPLPVGEGWVRALLVFLPSVFPAKAGIQWVGYRRSERVWIPAFAGNAVEMKGMNRLPLLRRYFPQRGKI